MIKIIRIIPVMAIVLAVGSAFTTKALTPINGYTRLVDFPNQGTPCKERVECDTQGTVACTFEGVQVYDVTCTMALNKIP